MKLTLIAIVATAMAAAPVEANCHFCAEQTVAFVECAVEDAANSGCAEQYVAFHEEHAREHVQDIEDWLGEQSP